MYIYTNSLKSQGCLYKNVHKESALVTLHNVNTSSETLILFLETYCILFYVHFMKKIRLVCISVMIIYIFSFPCQQVGRQWIKFISSNNRNLHNVYKCLQLQAACCFSCWWKIVLHLIKTPYTVLPCVEGQTPFTSILISICWHLMLLRYLI